MSINIESLLCYKLFFLVKTNAQLIDDQMRQLDLSRTQWRTLARFNFLPTPCTQQQLLISLDIDAAHLTRTLDQLEQRKLLLRTRLPSDKRVFTITLTGQGEKLLKKIEQILQRESADMVETFNSKEKKIFAELVHKATDNVLKQYQGVDE